MNNESPETKPVFEFKTIEGFISLDDAGKTLVHTAGCLQRSHTSESANSNRSDMLSLFRIRKEGIIALLDLIERYIRQMPEEPVSLDMDVIRARLETFRSSSLDQRENDWGYGQMTLDRIIQLGHHDEEKFTFFGTVSGPDDNWEPRTVVADKGSLFVFPLNSRSL